MPPATQAATQGTAVAPSGKSPRPEDNRKISIKNLIAGTRPAESIVSEPAPDAPGVIAASEFTSEELNEVWNAFAREIKEESPRISITLSAVSPERLPDNSIILKLDNMTLKEAFDHNFRARLENHLRTSLNNGTVKLQTTVETTERGEILYSPEQKFNHLASKNPSLRDLKKTFNLDFE
ncbi:MAG: hypothetical protein MZV63_11350 [Marinilabiliales bacterium]|nr:hypothetical protein [Marinilabiliales bacterium]